MRLGDRLRVGLDCRVDIRKEGGKAMIPKLRNRLGSIEVRDQNGTVVLCFDAFEDEGKKVAEAIRPKGSRPFFLHYSSNGKRDFLGIVKNGFLLNNEGGRP